MIRSTPGADRRATEPGEANGANADRGFAGGEGAGSRAREGARPVVSGFEPVGRPQARFRARVHSSDTPKRPTAS
jgi:hypothetical protein